GHPADRWLLIGASAFVAASAWGTLAGAARGSGWWWRSGRDLDGIARRLQQPAAAGGAVVLLWWLGGISIVPTGHQAVVERFGAALEQPASAGLLVRLPPPIERVRLVDVAQIRRLEIAGQEATLLCGDQSMVSLSATLHYTVTDAHRYLYAAVAPDAALQDAAKAAMTSVIGRLPQDAVLTDKRAEVEASVLALTRARIEAAGLGVAPEALHLTSVAVPATVMDAFLDVISADEERSTAINRAEAYAAAVIPEALGEAAATHQRALGEADLIAAEAAGWSAVFTAISDGGAAAPALTRHRLREEALVESLSEQPLVLIPSTMSLWLGDSPPGIPRMEGTREE
ncbi:MAG: membrane protease subunit HflK, partial [Myxococcota bacterium]